MTIGNITMKPIPFSKLSGSGNDFIVIDNRRHIMQEDGLSRFIAKVCQRRMSVGADGLILVEDADGVDFMWRYYNSDGSLADMCGNGARCVALFAFLNQIAGSPMSFANEAGIVAAEILGDRVKIGMPEPSDFRAERILDVEKESLTVSSINTGVPHVVVRLDTINDLDSMDIVRQGREIRFHRDFAPEGTNADFVSPLGKNEIAIRTYERGVEDETLACGTGAIAGAIVSAYQSGLDSPIGVRTQSGGFLNIYFKQETDGFHDVYLEGDARVIYTGELLEDSWKY